MMPEITIKTEHRKSHMRGFNKYHMKKSIEGRYSQILSKKIKFEENKMLKITEI